MATIEAIIEHIVPHELHYQTARSGGHGGQKVNKSETKVQLFFCFANSSHLTDEQKQRLQQIGKQYLCHDNTTIMMEDQETRHQHVNKEKVTHRFVQLLRDALLQPKKRKKTHKPRHIHEKRLTKKKHRGDIKQSRQKYRY